MLWGPSGARFWQMIGTHKSTGARPCQAKMQVIDRPYYKTGQTTRRTLLLRQDHHHPSKVSPPRTAHAPHTHRTRTEGCGGSGQRPPRALGPSPVNRVLGGVRSDRAVYGAQSVRCDARCGAYAVRCVLSQAVFQDELYGLGERFLEATPLQR